ncbi:MAG TPA: Sua5 family C-terminal domain-containing protein [Chitinophagales bacterium]|nr:Sua5 family C-terminal domain-containing protein [Chitinophagales bacterium]
MIWSNLIKRECSDIDLIITDYLPETGLGLAINDRLQRAAAK